MARKGWFVLPGQDGDRTLDEQMLAVRPALAEASGKRVLDLGCAEGLISREFALAGAAVVAYDSISAHLEVAKIECAGLPVMFVHSNLNDAVDIGLAKLYDIVLALGVLHKLRFPDAGLKFAARACRDLLLIRSGKGATGGIITSKHHGNNCDSHALLKAEGFALERIVNGPPERDENVEYWRRA